MNVYLMDFYDEYDKHKSVKKLEDFTALTFPKDGTDKLFIGCVLILITSAYRTRATAEALINILVSVKEKIGTSNLLKFYLERVNGNKLVSKYLFKVIEDDNLERNVDVILDYLNKMSFDFCTSIKRQYKNKINEYIRGSENNE